MTDSRPTAADIHDNVRDYYRTAAEVGAGDNVVNDDTRWGSSNYDDSSLADAPDASTQLSMGCGNPFMMAELQEGETVLDLGSGGGIDVILSAKRVAPTGKAYGLDFLPEMIELAQSNAAEAGVSNVEFLQGMIESVPLPDSTIDVILSNCVINLAPDKQPVFAEMARVLKPGGRIAVSDVVADDDYTPPADGMVWAECGAGALGRTEYLDQLTQAGLVDATIEYTHDIAPGLHAATVRAASPR